MMRQIPTAHKLTVRLPKWLNNTRKMDINKLQGRHADIETESCGFIRGEGLMGAVWVRVTRQGERFLQINTEL